GDTDHVKVMRSFTPADCLSSPRAGAAAATARSAHPRTRLSTRRRVRTELADMNESFGARNSLKRERRNCSSLARASGWYQYQGASFGASTPCSLSVEIARVLRSTTRIRCALVSARYNFPSA